MNLVWQTFKPSYHRRRITVKTQQLGSSVPVTVDPKRSECHEPSEHDHQLKDSMSRDIINAFDDAKIGIASGTYEIVGVPPIRVQFDSPGESTPPVAKDD